MNALFTVKGRTVLVISQLEKGDAMYFCAPIRVLNLADASLVINSVGKVIVIKY